LTSQGIQDLTYAIIIQAVRDWRSLCRGAKETKEYNFKELERFFKTDCAGYIDAETAKRIYNKLKKERRKAGL
jgi:phosphopantothenate synthetase